MPQLRLFFLGLKHPNPHVGEMRMAVETRALADELDLTDRFVFFNEDWVAFDDRANYFLDADIGISTAPRPRRDRAFVPAPASSITCGQPAGGGHPGRPCS
ncbi:MAG: hypothetical protein U0W40_07700 [Acidimicrobiia bacterium]